MNSNLILILLIILLPLIAQINVKTSYKKFSKIKNKKNVTGAEMARMILQKNNLENIYVVQTSGNLTDHYDPKRKVVRLSKNVYEGTSISSISIAAHECGHAIQDKDSYLFLKIRSFIFPVVNIATSISYYILLIGFLFELLKLVYIGIGFTALGLVFQIITLPVEFNASKRAKEELKKMDYYENGVDKVLTSAALTYVAGVLSSALQIIRLLLLAERR